MVRREAIECKLVDLQRPWVRNELKLRKIVGGKYVASAIKIY